MHLDVKPANVLVTSRESAAEHVYLADFGLTRRGATGHRTRGGDFLGSPTYAAPEHLRGEPVDARTDAYSLACVLFACLAGRPPFQGAVPEVIQGHLNRDVPALTDAVALPKAIDDVIRRGMAKSPKDRYKNCRELISAARQALAAPAMPDHTTPPVAVGPGPRTNGAVGPHPGGPAGYLPRLPASTPPGGYQRQVPAGTHSSRAEPVRLRPPLADRAEHVHRPTTPVAATAGSRRWSSASSPSA